MKIVTNHQACTDPVQPQTLILNVNDNCIYFVQAKLPDVNAAIVRHRSLAAEGYKTGNPELTIISIANINALLPSLEGGKSYKVEVDTEKYNMLRAETKHIECHFCKEQNLLNSVTQFDMEMAWLEQILAKRRTKRMWICNKCEKANVFSTDDITVTRKGNPYFFKVMPSPPTRQSGIRGRNTFDRDFEKWYSIAMPEIESQIGIYRSEYASQNPELVEMGAEEI